MTPEQINYVVSEMKRGMTEDTLRQTLAQHGYQAQQIENLIAEGKRQVLGLGDVPVPPTPSANPATTATNTPETAAAPAQSQAAPVVAPAKSGMPTWLIVILVIIGFIVLSFIGLGVLVSSSLDSARDKGEDAAAKVSLTNLRAQAEIHYDMNDGSYAGFCTTTAAAGFECNDGEGTWAASVSLNDGSHYCVDSMGRAQNTAESVGTAFSCGALAPKLP